MTFAAYEVLGAAKLNAAFAADLAAVGTAVANLGAARDRMSYSLASSGAVGNGTTNDQPVIQAWLNTLPIGATVVIPVNTFYYLGASLTVPKNVCLMGTGFPLRSPNRPNWQTGSGFICPNPHGLILSDGSGLANFKLKISGLFTNPTAAQCKAAVTAWGANTNHIGITVPPDVGGTFIKNVMVFGFNTAIRCTAGQFTFEDVAIDCYNGIDIPGNGDFCTMTRCRVEPYYSFNTDPTLGGWARPGDAFSFHGNGSGCYLTACSSFMYGVAARINNSAGVQIANSNFEWLAAWGNGILGTSGILTQGANNPFLACANVGLTGYNYGLNVQAPGDTTWMGGEIISDLACVNIAPGAAGCSGTMTGTVLYLANASAGYCVKVDNWVQGTNERWKFSNILPFGATTAVDWKLIDPASEAGVDFQNVRGTVYIASGSNGTNRTQNSILHERLQVAFDASLTTVDGSPTAPFTLRDIATGDTPYRLQQWRRGASMIGGMWTVPATSAWVQAMIALQAESTNGSIGLVPMGNGAIIAAKPDGTATGGGIRGASAIDLQLIRTSASQIASGSLSVVLGGRDNTASGLKSLAGGQGSVASGDTAFAWGYQHVIDGLASVAVGGAFANARGRNGVALWSGDPASAAAGDSQEAVAVWGVITSDATPTRLTAQRGQAANAFNVFNIPDGFSYTLDLTLKGQTAGNTGILVIQVRGAILYRSGGVTTLTGGTTTNWSVGTIGTMAGAFSGDSTNNGLNATATGIAATVIRWSLKISATE